MTINVEFLDFQVLASSDFNLNDGLDLIINDCLYYRAISRLRIDGKQHIRYRLAVRGEDNTNYIYSRRQLRDILNSNNLKWKDVKKSLTYAKEVLKFREL